MAAISHDNLRSAIFAGGCFWCVEADFGKRPDIKDIESGYTGGETDEPSYETAGKEGHREAVRLWYDPAETSYRELLAYFFVVHDPTDTGGSFHDRGHTYTSAVYYQNEKEAETAREVIETLEQANVFGKEIVTEVLPAETFWTAEEYHQAYAKKNVGHYNLYRAASGRDDFMSKHREAVYKTLNILK